MKVFETGNVKGVTGRARASKAYMTKYTTEGESNKAKASNE